MRSVFALSCLLLLLTGCQQSADFLATPKVAAPDSIRLTNINDYVYSNGVLTDDSSHLAIKYDDSLRSVIYTPNPVSDSGLDCGRKRAFFFDANGRWISEKVYNSPANTVDYIRSMTYDASGKPQHFHYNTYSGVYDAYVQHRTLGGNREITVVDTLCHDYPFNTYYRLLLNNADQVVYKVYLPSGLWPYRDSIVYTYDADGGISKEMDYQTEAGSTTLDVSTTTYQRDAGGSMTIFNFAKSELGKGLTWFEHDKDYYFSGLGDYDNGRPPLKKDVVDEQFISGVSTGIHYEEHSVFTNTYDANKNVVAYVLYVDGELYEKATFKYSR